MGKEYLVWIEVGGEQGYWQCEQVDYRICHGDTEEEILKDWLNQIDNGITLEKLEKITHGENAGAWGYWSRPIRIFELNKNFLPKENRWKRLKWE